MSPNAIEALIDDFENRRVMIVGDVMIDAYLWGKVDRISPEAPVPVFLVTDRENRLGGAANVALNVAALGAEPIICAPVGTDTHGQTFRELLGKRGMTDRGLFATANRPTTVKTRVISGHQHIVRVDEESHLPLNGEEENEFLTSIGEILDTAKPDVVVFEDYNKGALTPDVIEKTIAMAVEKGIPTAVDPKHDNFFAYKGATLFKPNLKELSEGLKTDIDKNSEASLAKAVDLLEAELKNKISLITLSEKGIYVSHGQTRHHLPAHVRKISDVSGAGDTVISVAALALASGANLRTMASLANLAGGLVCEHVGVVPIDRIRLREEAVLLPEDAPKNG